MAEVELPHAAAGIAALEDQNEQELAPTREHYRWMSDITNCVKALDKKIDQLRADLASAGVL